MKIKCLSLMSLSLLSACSIQVSGIQNAHHEPSTNSKSAILVSSTNTKIISIDGKSVNSAYARLTAGRHQITLYAGKNNYVAGVNTMYVLSATFAENTKYFAKATASTAWIENQNGSKVSSVVSSMQVKKSIGI